jgi:hypothetical protein
MFLDTLAWKTCQPFLSSLPFCKPNFIEDSRHELCVISPLPLRVCWYGIRVFSARYSPHANGSWLPFPRTVLNSSKTSEVPRTGEGLYREAPPFLPMCQGPSAKAQRSGRFYSGFGCAASASRNTLTLRLSTTMVPVSTHVGIAGAGAVLQSLNSCTAL